MYVTGAGKNIFTDNLMISLPINDGDSGYFGYFINTAENKAWSNQTGTWQEEGL